MSERLLVVEEAFLLPGRGVALKPRFSAARSTPEPFPVRLRLPGGEERAATAVIDVSHQRGPLPPFALIRLLDVAAEEVPAGTEVFRA